MWFENLLERLWERMRNKNSHLSLRVAFRYWILKCETPW